MIEVDGFRSPQMRHAVKLTRLYAAWRRPLLFLGPVGAGKTTLAAEAHRASRCAGRLVVVSAGEMTESLYSDTLFGHVTGAFTGAIARHRGCIEEASEGSLLLDDLALTSHVAQSALLRVLESGRYRPLGSERDQIASARFLFASTVDLMELAQRGDLLVDLASRVGELIVPVPPLAHCREDIVPLGIQSAMHFMREHGYQGSVTFADDCVEVLLTYTWPLNIRELRGVVERAVIHAGPSRDAVVVRRAHLPERVLHPPDEPIPGNLTHELVESVLRDTAGNQSEAARRLGVHRNTIARYLKTAG